MVSEKAHYNLLHNKFISIDLNGRSNTQTQDKTCKIFSHEMRNIEN